MFSSSRRLVHPGQKLNPMEPDLFPTCSGSDPCFFFGTRPKHLCLYYICINPNISTSCWVFSLNTCLIHIAEAAIGTTPSIYKTSSRLSEERSQNSCYRQKLDGLLEDRATNFPPKFVWFCAFPNYHQKIITNSHPDSNKIKIINISNIKNPNCIIPIWVVNCPDGWW